MAKVRTFCVDFDDYCDNVVETLDLLVAIKDANTNFKCTLFAIPQRCCDTTIAKAKEYDWIQLAPHGWRHTKGECLGWTDEEAIRKIELAKEMGIDAPLFRAPSWLVDGDVYKACKQLGYAVATHMEYQVPHSGVLEYVYNDPDRRGVYRIHGHLTNSSGNWIKNMYAKGNLNFSNDSKFIYPQELSKVY